MYRLSAIFALGGMALFISALISIGMYVLISLACYRVFIILGYKNAWMAWVPVVRYYGLGDVMADGRTELPLFGANVPAILFKLWFIGAWAVSFVPGIGGLLNIAVRVICYGQVLGEIFARIENRPYNDVKTIGYVSGAITIIAYIKFLMYDKNLRVIPVNPYENK